MTGAGGGIGSAVAREMNAAGVRIVAAGSTEERARRAAAALPATEPVWADLTVPDEAVYSAAKAGLIGLCKTLGQELARRGVTCNAVSPGPTSTSLFEEWRAEHPEQAEKLRRRIPAGRFGEPEEVAALVGFLCSDRAGYLTGQVISVNGGLHSP